MQGVLLTPTKAKRFRRQVDQALRDNPGLNVKELSELIELKLEICEPILFGNQDRYFGLGKPIRWKVRAGGPAAPKREQKRDASGRVRIKNQISRAYGVKSLQKRQLPPARKFKPYSWQRAAFNAWKDAGRRGIISAVTGSGKTRLAMLVIQDQLSRKGRVLIVVPTAALQLQWQREIKSWFPTELSIGLMGGGHKDTLRNHHILIVIVDSGRRYLPNITPGSQCLLIADECHRYASRANRRVLDEACSTRIGLTASLERDDGLHREVLAPYFGEIVYELTFERALEQRVIAPFRIANLAREFTNKERKIYDMLSLELARLRQQMLASEQVRAKPFSAFLNDVEMLKVSGKTEHLKRAAAIWLDKWAERRALLGGCQSKIAALTLMSKSIADARKTLVFCQTIEAAQQAFKTLKSCKLPVALYHSQMADAERQSVLEEFKEGQARVLIAVQALDEGIDVPDADLGVILGSFKTYRQMVQRLGRVLRRSPGKRFARFVYTFIQGTVEDPENDAHDSFMDEMEKNAEQVQSFDPKGQWGRLRRFLKPGRRSLKPSS